MNRIFLIVLLGAFMTVSSNAIAQSDGFGIKGGINLSSFGGDASGSDTRIGLNIGGFYNQVITGDFAVQPEAAFSLEGDDDVSFTNLNLGVMGKFNFEELMLEFGPQLGLILGDDEADAKGTNFTLGIGAGYMFSDVLTAGLRYNIGLSNVIDVAGVDITNSTFGLNIFYNL